MALDINGYNTTFKEFVQFAQRNMNAGDEKAVATAQVQREPLEGRKVVAVTNSLVDEVHKWRRSDTLENANDRTRTLFRNAVADIFGGEARIPENVREAMLLSDYDCGKPLTARRIMYVKAEVDKHSALFNRTFEALGAGGHGVYSMVNENQVRAPGAALVTKAQVDDLVKAVLETGRGDADALELLGNSAVMNGLLVRGNSTLRGPAEAKAKARDLLANLAGLREAAKGRPEVMAAGKKCLKALVGKCLPQGALAGIVRAVDAANVDAMKRLTASSSGKSIHKAVLLFTRLNAELMVSSGAEAALDGAEDKVAARGLIADLLVAKCGASNIRRMHGALRSENADKLMSVYDEIARGGLGLDGVSQGLHMHVGIMARRAERMLAQFRNAVAMASGVPQGEDDPNASFDGDFDSEAFGLFAFYEDFLPDAREEARKTRETFLHTCVVGNGAGAEKLRGLYGRKIGPEPFDPGFDVGSATEAVIGSMLKWNICGECRKFAEGRYDNTSFFAALQSGTDVTLPDGKKLSADFEAARDQLAEFATKGAAKTYAELDAKGRNKVHVLMSLLSQDLSKAAVEGPATALDPAGSSPAFVAASDQERDEHRFTLCYGPGGEFILSYAGRQTLQALVTAKADGGTETTMTGPGSTLDARLELSIPEAELDRLADRDYTHFDEAALRNIAGPNKYRQIAQAFPPEFDIKFQIGNVKLSTFLKATIN